MDGDASVVQCSEIQKGKFQSTNSIVAAIDDEKQVLRVRVRKVVNDQAGVTAWA